MAKSLISVPGAAMVVPDDELEVVGRDARAVIGEGAGTYRSVRARCSTTSPTSDQCAERDRTPGDVAPAAGHVRR